MRKLHYYILLILPLLFNTNCSEDRDDTSKVEPEGITLKFMFVNNVKTRVTDNDNTAIEQTVKNLSIFFTEPGSTTITNKFIYAGFSTVDDYRLVTLPLDPATVKTKDIYVIANYDDTNSLNAVSTIENLKTLTTPKVNKTNNLLPDNGFCMYGNTSAFNFNDGTNSAAIVNMVRTCAKIRVNLTFPGDPELGTNNSFLIENAATYTYVIKNQQSGLTTKDYFTYAAPIKLADNGAKVYINAAYVYEAISAPKLYIYTTIKDKQQEYSAYLPIPERNYLYDINIEVYEGIAGARTTSVSSNSNSNYTFRNSIKVYDENGKRVE